MNGSKLLSAAIIIEKAGGQIEAMIEILKNKMEKELENHEMRVDPNWGDDEDQSIGGWMLTSYLFDIAMLKKDKRAKKPFAHIAIKIVLFDKKEIDIKGWEPSIYVMYTAGLDEFEIDSFWLTEVLEEGCELDDNRRLWRWSENDENAGWGFVLPLVKLNNEEDLSNQVIYPIKELLAGRVFPANSIAFCYEVEGDIINQMFKPAEVG